MNGDVTVICCNVSYVWDHNRSVICPSGCGCNDASNEICCGGVVFLMEEFCGAVLGKVAKFIAVITLGSGTVVGKMTCPSTDKTLIITGHHTYCRRC